METRKMYENKPPRVNVRHRGALSLSHFLVSVMDKHFRDDEEMRIGDRKRAALEEILREFEKRGAYVVTDFDRKEYGLPARGPDGWTIDELTALEAARIEHMTKKIYPPLIVSGDTVISEVDLGKTFPTQCLRRKDDDAT